MLGENDPKYAGPKFFFENLKYFELTYACEIDKK